MPKNSIENPIAPVVSLHGFEDELTAILRDGARKMPQSAIEAEVAEYISAHQGQRDATGHRLVVRNGHHPERTIQTGIGAISIKKPNVNDKRVDELGERLHFQSSILPPYKPHRVYVLDYPVENEADQRPWVGGRCTGYGF